MNYENNVQKIINCKLQFFYVLIFIISTFYKFLNSNFFQNSFRIMIKKIKIKAKDVQDVYKSI